jgi:NRPS condensation-like uncharacterized protein
MSDLSKKVTDLSPEQLELLKKKMGQRTVKNKNVRSNLTIVPIDSKDGCFPLSWSQERLIGNSRNFITGIIRLQGMLNQDALKQSIEVVTKRHKVLNYVFYLKDDTYVQVMQENSAPFFEAADIEGHHGEKGFDLHEFFEEEIKSISWDLEKGPLFKLKLLKSGEREHFLLVKANSLVFDAASMDIFINDLACFYRYSSGENASKPANLPVQYGDYASWQRSVNDEKYVKLQAYWRNKLKRLNDAGRISGENSGKCSDKSDSVLNCGAQDKVPFQILPDMLRELRDTARREGVTLYTLLLSVYYCLLYKNNGIKEVCIGSYAENRSMVEIESMVGSFDSEIAFVIDFSDNMNFRELLQSVRDEVLETYTYQNVPSDVSQGQNNEDLSISSLRPGNMFLLNMKSPYLKEVGGLTLELLESDFRMPDKNMVLSLKEEGQGLKAVLLYNPQIIKEQTALSIADNFLYVLREVIKNPGIGLTELKINNEGRENFSEIEEILIGIWKEVLNCDRVGVNDNFFEIGGNSLRLVRMQEAIEKIYPGKLSIAKLFSYPTISGLASYLEGENKDSDDEEMKVPIKLLPLPLDFFVSDDDENEDIVLKASISDEVKDDLLAVSDDMEIDCIDTLLAIYIYLLSETIGEQQITVQTMIGGNELVYPLSMNMENITDFSELFTGVHKKRISADESDTYPLKLAGSMQLNKTENSIMTMFTGKEVSKDELLENYDIIFKILDSSSGIDITCEYNAKRLKKGKMEELLSDYINLIKTLIERMI